MAGPFDSFKAGAESAMRTVSRGVAMLPWEDSIDEQNPGPELGGQEGFFGAEAKARAEEHPTAAMVGQGVALAPLALTPGGVVAGVLGEAAAGGFAQEAEEAWKTGLDFNQEAAFQNVGAGILVGGAVVGAGALAGKAVSAVRRNLFTEAEHAVNARAGRELLDRAPTRAAGESADEIAGLHPDAPGASYLRENASDLHAELGASQAKAAQDLIDTYDSLASLRPKPADIAAHIPDNPIDQSRWVTQARDEIGKALDDVDPAVAGPLREKLATLGEGKDPAQWFTRSSELSDALLKAQRRESQSGHTVLGKRAGLPPKEFATERRLGVQRLNQRIADLPIVGHSEVAFDMPPEVKGMLDDHANAALETLTPAERDAVSSYTGGSYDGMRSIQKGEQLTDMSGKPMDSKRTALYERRAADLDTAVSKLRIDNPTQHGPLYRGLPATDDMIDEIMRHDEFITSATTSSGYDSEIAEQFATRPRSEPTRKLVIKINKLDHGANLLGDVGVGESEILVPKGAKFRVTKRRQLSDGTVLVDVEQIGTATAKDAEELGALGAVDFTPPGKADMTLGDIAKSPIGVTSAVGLSGAAALEVARRKRRRGE